MKITVMGRQREQATAVGVRRVFGSRFFFLISSWSQSSSEQLQNTESELHNLEQYTPV